MDFKTKLQNAISNNNSLLCVGLDPDPSQGPTLTQGRTLFEFNKKIIDETKDLVCAYKPNIAFYEAAGQEGLEALKKTIDYIHETCDVPVILDAKMGDIGHTAEMYAKAAFDVWDADAVTLSPYLGEDSLTPFFKRAEKGAIILCKTSNSSGDIQDLQVDGEPLYLNIAKKAFNANKRYKNILLVVGATHPGELKKVREVAPDLIFLVPGIGAQGGNLEATLKNGLTQTKDGLIISSSRGIIYAQNPKEAAQQLRDEINKYRS